MRDDRAATTSRAAARRAAARRQIRRYHREARLAFRLLGIAALGFSVIFAVGLLPDVMFRDADPAATLMLAAAPVLIVGGLWLVWELVRRNL